MIVSPSTSPSNSEELSLNSKHQCQVCELYVHSFEVTSYIRNGGNFIAVCQACRRFFGRNRNKDCLQLRCFSGNGSCAMGEETATTVSSGAIWRMVCPRCRLLKCLAIGLEDAYNSRQKRKGSPSPQIPDDTMNSLDHAVGTLTFGLMEVQRGYESSILCSQEVEFLSDIDAWNLLSKQTVNILHLLLRFSQNIPGFTEYPEVVQTKMFFRSAGGVMLSISAGINGHPCTMNASNYSRLIKYFPEFEFAESFTRFLSSVISGWGHRSSTAFPCLLIILLYQSEFTCESDLLLPSNEQAAKASRIVTSILRQIAGGDEARFQKLVQEIFIIAKAFKTVVEYRDNALSIAMAKRNYLMPPDISSLKFTI